MALHGYAGELCNFYIFTDPNHFAMHTDAEAARNNIHSGHGHSYFRGGTLRLDGEDDVPVAQMSRWTDQGLRVAVLR